MEIRRVSPADAEAIALIYNHFVTFSTITFEEQPVTAVEIGGRISAVLGKELPWLVAVEQNVVRGFAYATPWKTRSAYRFSVEVTVYIEEAHTGRGLGSALYSHLLDTLTNRGFHTVLAGIALPNSASVALHERFHFVKVAHLSQIGFKKDHWIDVGYWQLHLR